MIDFERMKYPNTGLFHFCLHLGKALVANKSHNNQLSFYVPESVNGCFGNEVNYVNQQAYHKLVFPGRSKYNIWHAAQQGTEYFPFGSKCKKVLTIHDINFMHDTNKSEHKKNNYLEDLSKKISHCDFIVAISNFVMNDVLRYIPISPDKRKVIYNGCNIEEQDVIKEPIGVPTSPFLYTIGVIAEKKNFHVLPPLLRNNNLRLIISGIVENEDYKQKIIAEAKKFGVHNRLTFTGAVSENDKQWYYKNCTAFVFPSLSEGFGLPIIEAMYFGKPTILSCKSSLPEVGGEHAYYFKNFDPDEMCEVLEKSLEHYTQTRPMELIKQRAKNFSWQQAAGEYLNVYDSLFCNT